jgi:hypothetical protein
VLPCAFKMTSQTSQYDAAIQSINNITILAKELPKSVADASKTDRIYTALKDGKPSDSWETWNRRFDLVFGEHLRNKSTGRLHEVRRGRFGMSAFFAALRVALVGHESAFKDSWDILQLRLDRVEREMEEIWCVKCSSCSCRGAHLL